MNPDAAETHLRERYGETLAAVEAALAVAAAGLDAPASRERVVARQETALREAGTLDPLAEVLASAVAAAGAELAARPVPAPPYVVLTGRGPMLRGSDGERRLVVLLQGFERAGDGRGYLPASFSVEVSARD